MEKIVLTALITFVVVLLLFITCLWVYLNLFLKDRKNTHDLLNKIAPKNPIVFLGDSLTDFYSVNGFFCRADVINRGIASDRVCEVEKRVDGILQLDPKMVILQIGVNDLIKTFLPPNPKKVAKNIINLVERIKTKTQVKVVSLYPVNFSKKFFSFILLGYATNGKIKKVNEILKNYCLENGVDFIDVHSKLVDKKGKLNEKYTIEGLHISAEGYKIISEEIGKFI